MSDIFLSFSLSDVELIKEQGKLKNRSWQSLSFDDVESSSSPRIVVGLFSEASVLFELSDKTCIISQSRPQVITEILLLGDCWVVQRFCSPSSFPWQYLPSGRHSRFPVHCPVDQSLEMSAFHSNVVLSITYWTYMTAHDRTLAQQFWAAKCQIFTVCDGRHPFTGMVWFTIYPLSSC